MPYNPYLSSKYKSHINVECCNSVGACKYLFKYVYKGTDRKMAQARKKDAPIDEITEYHDMRVVGSSEACWRTFTFEMSHCKPCVVPLTIHLENGMRVYFEAGEEAVRAAADPPRTKLTAWFEYNMTHPVLSAGVLKRRHRLTFFFFDISLNSYVVIVVVIMS